MNSNDQPLDIIGKVMEANGENPCGVAIGRKHNYNYACVFFSSVEGTSWVTVSTEPSSRLD